MRNGYPAGLNIEPSQDSGNRGDPTPHFFTKVFESMNDYVLVYQVNYPQTPTLTAMLNNPYVPKGNNNANNITGTLNYPNSQPVVSNTRIILQYAKPNDNTWTFIANSTLTTSGTYQFLWNKVPSGNGPIHVRAWWNGDPTLGLNIALSANQTLIQL